MTWTHIVLAICAALFPLAAGTRTHRIPSPVPGLKLFLRQQSPKMLTSSTPVLILHGATFPSANAAAWPSGGASWMDQLEAEGREVWALDFLGYGESDRYPEMAQVPIPNRPLGDLTSLLAQVDLAVRHIAKNGPVDLVAHSAGTLVAGCFAEQHPTQVRRLVLFGAPGPQPPQPAAQWPSYFLVSAEDQWVSLEAIVKATGRWPEAVFKPWSAAYLASDPTSFARLPASVRVPSGLMSIYSELARTGDLPYRPEALPMPTLLILGEWDAVTPLPQSLAIFQRLPSPGKRLIVIGQGGHRMHVEASREAFFKAVSSYLKDN